MEKKNVVVLDIISLTEEHLNDAELTPNIRKLLENGQQARIKPVFPAVTGSMQATYIAGTSPAEHGIICNGLPNWDTKEITMWNQTMLPVEGKKIWEKLKEEDLAAETAVLFWQFSKLSTADYVVTPAPIHLDKKTIMWCDSKPRGLYEKLRGKYGEFDLKSFWGPLSSVKSSEWILDAAIDVLEEYKPRLSLVYLPNIDYNAQRFGPESEAAKRSIKEIDSLIGNFVEQLEERNLKEQTRLVILSEYNFKTVNRPIFINQTLNKEGYVAIKHVENMDFLDLEMSKAFALADHQLAHVYIQDSRDIGGVKEILERTPGIAEVWGEEEKRVHKINHELSGQLIAIAEPDSWFVYYWWLNDEQAPEFAYNVDIHRKPGYDPVELFVNPKTLQIPLEPERIKGSHGLPAKDKGDYVSLVVTGRDFELPDTLEATEVHDLLLKLVGNEKG
ncbi:alkaline phosphatase family protein [Bacillus cereus group sp. BY128LC]|uniref:alkaline phosphatase family protein n=1 Tax=Bacillus cereus group sp. BY128LC TaxID=3018084 RepID=UPI0022E1E268|nr:alkaline phosphatase family protein [Bacillus cereus group sp. BY128LC]MDA1862825.1 alkaline phosphatase family protein [Bacillus cereus group sp. BY128LC]